MFRTLKCIFGFHDVPRNLAFEEIGSVFAGGICAECGDLKRGKFLGNTWTEEIKHEQSRMIELIGRDISFATKKGYAVIPLLVQKMRLDEGRSVLTGKPL